MKLVKYLGQKASVLLEAEPFMEWHVDRTIDDDSDPPLVSYSFGECGLQFNCDRDDECIRSLFLDKDKHAGIVLSEVPFGLHRAEVLSQFGNPSKSGDRVSHPILGNFGAWDRFRNSGYTLHVQYGVDKDRIEKITLMRNDVAP